MNLGFKRWLKMETGAASVSMFILAMPLILGSFGFGFDAVRAIYIKNYVQNRADIAVQQAVAGNTNTQTDGSLLISQESLDAVLQNYRANTSSYRNSSMLDCPANISQGGIYASSTSQDPNSKSSAIAIYCNQSVSIIGSPASASSCSNLSNGNLVKYGIHYEVKEQIGTVFLRILGINTMNLGTVKAEALVRATC